MHKILRIQNCAFLISGISSRISPSREGKIGANSPTVGGCVAIFAVCAPRAPRNFAQHFPLRRGEKVNVSRGARSSGLRRSPARRLNARAFAVAPRRRSQLLTTAYKIAVDLLGSVAAIRRSYHDSRGAKQVNNSRGAKQVSNSRGLDLLAAIIPDPLAAITVVDLHAAIKNDRLAAIVN